MGESTRTTLFIADLMPKYRDMGFNVFAEWNMFTSSGVPNKTSLKTSETNGVLLKTPDESDVEKIVQYDKLVTMRGDQRQLWCRGWIRHPTGSCIVAVDAKGVVLGYGVVRKCLKKYKMGPVFADSASIAANIIKKLLDDNFEEIKKYTVAITYRSNDKRMISLMSEIGLVKDAVFHHMHYTKQKIVFDEEKFYVFSDFCSGYT